MTPAQADKISAAQVRRYGHHYINPSKRDQSFCGKQLPKPLYGGFYHLSDFATNQSPVEDYCPHCWQCWLNRMAHFWANHVTMRDILDGDTFCTGCGKDWDEKP